MHRGSTPLGKVYHSAHPNLVLSRHFDANGNRVVPLAECGTYSGRAVDLFQKSQNKEAFAFLVPADHPRPKEIPENAKVFEVQTANGWMKRPDRANYTLLDFRKVKLVYPNAGMIFRGQVKAADRTEIASLVRKNMAGGLSELEEGTSMDLPSASQTSPPASARGSYFCWCDCHCEHAEEDHVEEDKARKDQPQDTKIPTVAVDGENGPSEDGKISAGVSQSVARGTKRASMEASRSSSRRGSKRALWRPSTEPEKSSARGKRCSPTRKQETTTDYDEPGNGDGQKGRFCCRTGCRKRQRQAIGAAQLQVSTAAGEEKP